MTDATQAQPTTPPTQQAEAPKPQAIDVAKMTEEITSSVTKSVKEAAVEAARAAASENLKAFGRQLTGENEPNPNAVAAQIMKDEPLKFASTLVEVAKREIRTEDAQAEANRRKSQAIAEPFVKEYPALLEPKKIAYVERMAEHYIAEGLSKEEALKKGFEDGVKDFNLKSASDLQKEGATNLVSLPTGGSFYPTGVTRPDEAQQHKTFIDGIKARAKAVRTKKAS